MRGTDTTEDDSKIRVLDVVRAIAFIGDLSMGQPTDHSLRTAWIGGQLAQALGCSVDDQLATLEVSLLRWSGCTANAAGFSELLSDDVAGREAMLAMRPEWAKSLDAKGGPGVAMAPLAQVHCEVSGDIARMLGLGTRTEEALRNIFEMYDGAGIPGQLGGDQIPLPVFLASVAGDLEIFDRVYGLASALELIARKSGQHYPGFVASCAIDEAKRLLTRLADAHIDELEMAVSTPSMSARVAPELIADVIDLKLPWMTGYSRAVAHKAMCSSADLGFDEATRSIIYRAGLIHGMGRAAVSNSVWNTPGPLSSSSWEKVRLAPYWTMRAAKQIRGLEVEARLASFVYERSDGSGYFRGADGISIPPEAQILSLAAAWVALQSDRPWRAAVNAAEAEAILRERAAGGAFDPNFVRMICSPVTNSPSPDAKGNALVRLSVRELEVLRLISHGSSNKEAARLLGLSPSTVRTHVESIFRKLSCSTRAAATLKASSIGLLP